MRSGPAARRLSSASPPSACSSPPRPRLDADAVEYFSHVRSLYFDRDLDFANEFAHFGILTRGDKVRPTVTGHRRTIFSVGPALLWMPFYAAGDLRRASRLRAGGRLLAVPHPCGVPGQPGLRRRGPAARLPDPGRAASAQRVAFWTSILLLYATFLVWYLVYEAAMSHAAELLRRRPRAPRVVAGAPRLPPGRARVLGLLVGLAATVRWQNAVLLLLPAFSLARALRCRPVATLSGGTRAPGLRRRVLAPAAGLEGDLRTSTCSSDPPHGQRLPAPRSSLSPQHLLLVASRPALLDAGLVGGFLGFGALFRRDRFTRPGPRPAARGDELRQRLLGRLVGGGSFSNRRFDSVLPLLALGRRGHRSRRSSKRGAAPAPADRRLGSAPPSSCGTSCSSSSTGRRRSRPDDTVSFAAVTGYNAEAAWAGYAGTAPRLARQPGLRGRARPARRALRPRRSASTSSTARTTWAAS